MISPGRRVWEHERPTFYRSALSISLVPSLSSSYTEPSFIYLRCAQVFGVLYIMSHVYEDLDELLQTNTCVGLFAVPDIALPPPMFPVNNLKFM